MVHAVELARFTASDEAQLKATRPAAIAALKQTFPGMLQATLPRMDDGTYLDILVWQDKQCAQNAAQNALSLPEFADWARHIETVISLEHAEVVAIP